MFSSPTVFIIGAGAGIELGMPDGAKLSNKIGEVLDIKYNDLTKRISGDPQIERVLHEIANARHKIQRLAQGSGDGCGGVLGSPSIDNFLNMHRNNEEAKICGKLAIAQIILAHEKHSALYVKDGTREFADRDAVKNSWLPDFLNLIQNRVVVDENLDNIFDNLCIINFNYDRCVEQFLYNAMQPLFGIGAGRASELMGRLKIFHPYGQVGFMDWDKPSCRKVLFGETDYSDLVALSGEIRTFNERQQDVEVVGAIRTE